MNVFAFSEKRDEVARFFDEVLGLSRREARDDSIWFEPDGGATFTVHDREDEPDVSGFVPWFHVADLAATYERAKAKVANVGAMRDGYFFARDPDGRVFGVREWR
jgi:predicted enzyme related to lactoylglutathione lyase